MHKFLFSLLFILLFMTKAFCIDVWHTDVDDAMHVVDDDIVIEDNVNVLSSELYIAQSVYIKNNGNISAEKISVCPRCKVYIENNGVIDSEFVLGDYAQIFQIVSSKDGLNAVNFNTDYIIRVENADEVLSLADVVDFAPDSSKIFLENVRLEIDRLPNEKSKKIELGNNVVFVITDAAELYDMTVLDNVLSIGGGAKFEYFISDDNLYSNVGRLNNDGTLVIEHVRKTDYDTVVGGDKGDFIESIVDENNKLKDELNSATDINNTLSKTALFNSDVLQNILRVITSMDMVDFNSNAQNAAGLSAFVILSDDFYVRGADINARYLIKDNFDLSLSLKAGQILYSSDLEDFDGHFYGLNLSGDYRFEEDLFLRAGFGIMKTVFDIDKVWYNNKFISEPDALSGHLVADFGKRFVVNDSFFVSPFIGVAAELYDVAGDSCSEYGGRFGVSADYKYVMSDLEYRYGMFATVDTNGTMSLVGNIGFMLPLDMISGNLKLTVIRMLDTLSYQASVDAKLLF